MTTSTNHRCRGTAPVLAAALTLALALGLLAAPGDAGAEEGDAAGHADLAAQGQALSEAAAATSAAAPDDGEASTAGLGQCYADPTGDEWNFSDEEPAGGEQPRADLVEHCLRYGPTLALSAEVAEPTHPEVDPNWHGATFVGWFLDTTGNGEGDYFVDFSLDAEEQDLTAQVQDVADGEPGEAVCEASASVARGVYHVSDIDPDCIGGSDDVRVNAAVFYDTDPDADGGVFYDDSPSGGEFTAAETPQDRVSARLGGVTRIETSVEISQRQFPSRGDAERVYLARSDVFADAVAGGTVPDGPILLTPTDDAHPDVRQEIERLDPDEVVALGGTAAIQRGTLAQAAGNRPTDRYSGPGRMDTAVDISRNVFPGGAGEVYLARADMFADAVVGGSLTGGPILLVPREGTVPQAVADEVDRVDPDRVIALGGTAAVSQSVLSSAAGNRDTDRLAGPGRIDTAVEIARYEFPSDADDAFLARADLFADAVVGGTLTDGPTLLVPSEGDLPRLVAGEISRMSPPRVTALGGTAAISEGILQQAVDS